jgi:hypothetical protein
MFWRYATLSVTKRQQKTGAGFKPALNLLLSTDYNKGTLLQVTITHFVMCILKKKAIVLVCPRRHPDVRSKLTIRETLNKALFNPLYPPFLGDFDAGGHPQTPARKNSGLLFQSFLSVKINPPG